MTAGSWLALPVQPAWQFCLGGNQLTVDCQINPVAWPSAVRGFANGGTPLTCWEGIDCTIPLSVETSSWGKVKTLYR